MWGRGLAAWLLAASCGATPAVAATRVAGPAGSGVTCSDASPCAITTAINSAGVGDEVIVNPGDYGTVAAPLATALSTAIANVTIHGRDGAPRPLIVSSNVFALTVQGAGDVLRDIALHSTYPSNGVALFLRNAVLAERVQVRADGTTSVACAVLGTAAIRDATCLDTGDSATGLDVNGVQSGPNDVTAANVTAIVTGAATGDVFGNAVRVSSTSGRASTLTATNVIAQGATHDVEVSKSSDPAIARLDHSDAADIHVDGGGTVTDLGGNVTAVAAFVDAAAYDFHELPGSPTVDAGRDDPLNGSFAFDGVVRLLGARTDIGAAEYIPPPNVTTGAAGPIGTTTATLAGSANPNGGSASAHFEYGTSTAYGQQTADVPLGAGTQQVEVGAALTGLQAATTYHYRLVASNSSGTVPGADATFATAALPPVLQAPSLTAVKQSHRVWRVDRRHRTPASARARPRGTRFSYTLSADATVRFTIQRARPHKRFKTVMRLRRAAHAGAGRTRFTGRVGRRRLKPGRYRVVIRASNAAGPSAAKRLRFRVVR
jgi:hypothetical protein